MQTRERTTLIAQMLTGTNYGPATVWRCVLGLALLILVTLPGTYQIAARGGTITTEAAKRLRTVDDARAATHRKAVFDSRRQRFE